MSRECTSRGACNRQAPPLQRCGLHQRKSLKRKQQGAERRARALCPPAPLRKLAELATASDGRKYSGRMLLITQVDASVDSTEEAKNLIIFADRVVCGRWQSSETKKKAGLWSFPFEATVSSSGTT
jgi:hypothetical protein